VAAPPRAAAPTRAWASLPPIQRTAGDMPTVAAPGEFVGALPGSHALPPIVQPLGHEVSSLATPGLVVARVRPVEAAATGSIPAPVQRKAARASRAAGAAPSAAPAMPEVVEVAAPDVVVASAPVAPIRSMPTVSRAAVRVPDRPLTSAASAARPAAVQREAAAAASGSSTAPLPAVPPGGMRRAPAATPAAPATPAVSRQASASHTDLAAPTSAAPLRRGLGEPMTSLPASARPVAAAHAPVISRTASAGAMPVPVASPRAPTHRSASSSPASGPLPALGQERPGAPAGGAAARLPELPHLPVAGSAAVSGSAPVVARASAPADPPATSTPAVRPIAGANPLRPSIALQRSATDDGNDDALDDAALPSPWWAPAAEAGTHAVFGGTSPSDGHTASVQRSADGGAAPISSNPFAITSRAPTLAGRPGPGRAPVQRLADAAARPGLPVDASRDPAHRSPGPAWTRVEPGPAPSQAPRTIVGDPVVQTSPAQPGAAAGQGAGRPGGAVVQRDEIAAPTPPAPVAPAGPSSATPSERDLDELAQALFGRIRGRLRNDLIHDREAKGLTFDHI
jgi:hypothetical protein